MPKIAFWESNFQISCPQTPIEACVPMILGVVDSLAGPSSGIVASIGPVYYQMPILFCTSIIKQTMPFLL